MVLKHKTLAILICILIVSISAGTAFGRSRKHRIHRPTPTPSVKVTQTATASAENLLEGQWHYMPGIKRNTAGIIISPMNFSLVEQDGTFAQANPPINLVGTHLEKVTGDFKVNMTIKASSSSAIIQLYGETPIIADEFRVERKSIQGTLTNGKLTISIWNGSNQKPSKQTYSYVPQDTVTLVISRKGTSLVFAVNDNQMGIIKDPGIFNSGQVWFGFDAKENGWLLSNLSIEKVNGGTFDIADASTMKLSVHDSNGLQALVSHKRPGFIVGAAQALGPLVSDPHYSKIAMDNNVLGSWTSENLMKMINMQPQKGIYSFEQADGFVKLAKQNNISIHGHTLVFAEANPVWFNQLPVQTASDKKAIETIMVDHITKVVGHFKREIASWDVINEPMADYDDTPDGEGASLRKHKWYQAMGQDYIIKALKAAHDADPDAILFINEYGLEADGDRWDAFVTLLQHLKIQLQQEGIPTDKIGVGFQAHVYEEGDKIDAATLRNHIKELGALGFKAQISEMDVYIEDGEIVQGQQYADVFNACFSESNCVAWRGWILSDRYDYFIDDDGSIQTGEDGLFGSDMKPRPGYTRIQSLLLK